VLPTNRNDVLPVEETREPKGTPRPPLTFQAIAKRYAPGVAAEDDRQ
jgi:hypothetical protein